MLPFSVPFKPGVPIYEQVVYAVKKAVVCGLLRPGEGFPSVRSLSQELKINPNTAHKVIAQLVAEGLLEVRPGIGTVVAAQSEASDKAKAALLDRELEHLVVEAKKLSLSLEDLLSAARRHWRRLEGGAGRSSQESSKGRRR